MEKNTLVRKNISDQIADILKEKIIRHEYADGEKLPGENELAEIYGVSRMTARTVFQKLSSLGLVEIRNGEGTFAKSFDLKDYFQQALSFMNEQNTTEDIREFRRYFEPMCNELASQKRTEKDIEELTKLYDELVRSCDSNDVMDFLEADYNFHRYICRTTGNPIIIMIYEMFMNLVKKDYEDTLKKYAVLNNYSFSNKDENYALRMSAKLHRNILDGIISQDMTAFNDSWPTLSRKYDYVPLPDRDWE